MDLGAVRDEKARLTDRLVPACVHTHRTYPSHKHMHTSRAHPSPHTQAQTRTHARTPRARTSIARTRTRGHTQRTHTHTNTHTLSTDQSCAHAHTHTRTCTHTHTHTPRGLIGVGPLHGIVVQRVVRHRADAQQAVRPGRQLADERDRFANVERHLGPTLTCVKRIYAGARRCV